MVWNKEKEDLDKVVWVNQVVLFLQSFCFTIELLAFQANNVKLCLSCRYCSCLTHFGSIFPFYALWNHQKSVVFWSFQGVQKINIDLNWFNNILQCFAILVLKTIDSENKPICLRFGILNSVFSIQNWCFAFFNSTI